MDFSNSIDYHWAFVLRRNAIGSKFIVSRHKVNSAYDQLFLFFSLTQRFLLSHLNFALFVDFFMR